MQKYKNYINGEFVESQSGNSFKTIDPSTEKEFAEVSAAEEYEVNLAVESANNAFHGEWSKILPYQRAHYLRAIGDQLKEKAELLGTVETKNTGKLYKETKFQANYIAEYYYYYAGLVDKVEGSTLPIDKEDMHVFTTRVPLGVVAAIIPWNSQMFLTAVKLAPALAMGNTIIIKASEIAPTPLLEFAKIIHKVGLPKGVVNIITGYADTCSSVLTSHTKINKIAFTGGVHTAKHIVKNSAENLSQLSLELGGKSPVVVFNDARKDNAINGIMASIFGAGGQSCIAGSRLYLQSKIYDEFLKKLISKAEKIKLGGPMEKDTQMGPLNSFKQLENIEKNIKATIEQGGKIRCGGKRSSVSNKGYYFPATIIECKNHNLPVAENELFGPILSVMKFDKEDEVINKMNDNKYGLSSGVYTSNFARGLRVSKAIRAGIVFINTYRLISPMAPFGGIKDSGYGKEAGIESIKEYTRIKTTWYNSSDKPMTDPFTMG